MQLPIYQIDAFARVPFEGNPAAVCPLSQWLDEGLMQRIAQENNLSETAFFVPEGDDFRIRWFTPSSEIELCGHATLASAFVLWQYLGYAGARIQFHSLSGPLQVSRQGERLELDFPARPMQQQIEDPALLRALNCEGPVQQTLRAGDRVLVELEDEQQLMALTPDFRVLLQLPYRLVYVTSRGRDYDFVCRMFAPAFGIDEDPVTGSAYTALGPYWAEKLNKRELTARQVSRRGGDVYVKLDGERVLIAGYAVCVLKGEILLPS